MEHEPSIPHGQVAVTFAAALVNGDFERAYALLAPDLRRNLSPDGLREALYAMFEGYSDGKPERIYFNEEFANVEWPGKLPGDVGWAYVGIEGEGFLEAVTIIVADIAGDNLIREIEWGRP